MDAVASNAIDGNLITVAHTECSSQPDTWFKMVLGGVNFVGHVDIYPSHSFNKIARRRMGGMVVNVVNSSSGTQTTCGKLKVVGNVELSSMSSTEMGITVIL